MLLNFDIGHHTATLAADQGRHRFKKLLNEDSATLLKTKGLRRIGMDQIIPPMVAQIQLVGIRQVRFQAIKQAVQIKVDHDQPQHFAVLGNDGRGNPHGRFVQAGMSPLIVVNGDVGQINLSPTQLQCAENVG